MMNDDDMSPSSSSEQGEYRRKIQERRQLEVAVWCDPKNGRKQSGKDFENFVVLSFSSLSSSRGFRRLVFFVVLSFFVVSNFRRLVVFVIFVILSFLSSLIFVVLSFSSSLISFSSSLIFVVEVAY
jgi:hypothetical protein